MLNWIKRKLFRKKPPVLIVRSDTTDPVLTEFPVEFAKRVSETLGKPKAIHVRKEMLDEDTKLAINESFRRGELCFPERNKPSTDKK